MQNNSLTSMSGLGLTAADAHAQVDILGVGADTYITFANATLQRVGVSSNQISFGDVFFCLGALLRSREILTLRSAAPSYRLHFFRLA